MLELQQDDREMLTERAQATAEKIQRLDEEAYERSRNPAEDPFKVLCPLCGTYTYANLRYCIRCLGEVATSTPVGARSPNDRPSPPKPTAPQPTDPLSAPLNPFPPPMYPYGPFSGGT
jgi:hypothetical protein